MVDSIIDQESEEGSVKVSISKGVFNSPSLDMQVSSEENDNETLPKLKSSAFNLQAGISTLKKTTNNLQSEKSKIQNLTAAKLELIELQKTSVSKEIEYQRCEFQQRTEYQLRIKQMEEEHEWRMTDLRSKMEKKYL